MIFGPQRDSFTAAPPPPIGNGQKIRQKKKTIDSEPFDGRRLAVRRRDPHVAIGKPSFNELDHPRRSRDKHSKWHHQQNQIDSTHFILLEEKEKKRILKN